MKPTRKRGSRYLKLVGNQMHKKKAHNCSPYLTTHRGSQGQSLVEFALLIPILALILVGVFDLGRAFHALITISNAAREGARYGTLHPDKPLGMKLAAVSEAADSGVTITTADVTVSCATNPDGSCVRGGVLRVTVTYTFESLLNMIIPASLDLQRYIEMAVQ